MFGHRVPVVTAVALLLFAGTCVLQAQPAEGGQAADFFDKLDTNRDGKIGADEFRGSAEAFARMDRDGDGSITRDELAGGGDGAAGPGRARRQGDPATRWQQMLQRFDADRDGQISAEEFRGPEQVLTLLDANKDGVITQEEAMNASNLRGGGAAGDPAQRWQRLLQASDADGDGKISQAEWPGRPEMFARLDADGDGVIAQEEMPQPGAAGPAERPQRQNPAQLLIRLMDLNGDGQVSEEEWANFFGVADVNTDGMISHDELMKKLQEALRPAGEPGPVEEPAAPEEGF